MGLRKKGHISTFHFPFQSTNAVITPPHLLQHYVDKIGHYCREVWGNQQDSASWINFGDQAGTELWPLNHCFASIIYSLHNMGHKRISRILMDSYHSTPYSVIRCTLALWGGLQSRRKRKKEGVILWSWVGNVKLIKWWFIFDHL